VWKIIYWSLSIDRAGPRRHIRIASFAVALEGRRVGSALGFRILIGRQLGEQATTAQDRRSTLSELHRCEFWGGTGEYELDGGSSVKHGWARSSTSEA